MWKSTFKPEEDRKLLKLHDLYESQWQFISEFFVAKPANMVKQRFYELKQLKEPKFTLSPTKPGKIDEEFKSSQFTMKLSCETNSTPVMEDCQYQMEVATSPG